MGAAAFRFDGKRAVVVGGATGIGRAAAELALDLGADVVVLDRLPVTQSGIQTGTIDLSEKASIDGAVAECGGPIDVLFSCAGVADGTPGIERINFIGHRHFIDRALGAGMLAPGSAIGMISSAAGLGWEANLDLLKTYLDTPDFEAAVEWIDAHPTKADYMWSKQAICAYVAKQAFSFLQRGIRINAILPGPTDTPLAQANADLWLGFGQDFRSDAGIEASTAEQQAHVLAFLCSDAASYVSGITMLTDAGYVSSGVTGSFPAASGVVSYLRGG